MSEKFSSGTKTPEQTNKQTNDKQYVRRIYSTPDPDGEQCILKN